MAEQVRAQRSRAPRGAERLPRDDRRTLHTGGLDDRDEVLGPLLLHAARPVRHRIRQADAPSVEDDEPSEGPQTGLEPRRDPILGQQFEREERARDDDDIGSARLTRHAVRDVSPACLCVRDAVHTASESSVPDASSPGATDTVGRGPVGASGAGRLASGRCRYAAPVADWTALSARASMASHRLIGWIYWDPGAIAEFTALGIDNGLGYYIASRSAPLAPAGHQAVAAAFYSIHPGFIEMSLTTAAAAATWTQITDARNRAVGIGLGTEAPEICDALAALAEPLWATADSLPSSGRVLFAAHRQWPRPEDPLVSAWLAVNCLREYRGDTHFAVLLAEGLSGTQAGLLHNAHLNYPVEWIPRSRGADDAALIAAMADLEARGLAADGKVSEAGIALRDHIEDRTNALTARPWQALGEELTCRFLDLVEPVGPRFLARVDATAGPDWMPAARERRPS